MLPDWKALFPDLPAGPALDVGTRFGEFALRLRQAVPAGEKVIGLDCSEKTVAQAKEKFPDAGVEFAVGEGAALAYPDDSFALVAISNTLHHIEDYNKVLDEMYRVLKPGGYFVVNEMFSDNQNTAQRAHYAQHTFEAKLDMITGKDYQVPTWKKDEIVAICARLPLKDVRTLEFTEAPEMDRKLAAKTPKLIERVEKLSDRPDYAELLAEARAIVAQVERDGIQRCTQLLYIGRK
jgi:SAM-dependent methyltransferase